MLHLKLVRNRSERNIQNYNDDMDPSILYQAFFDESSEHHISGGINMKCVNAPRRERQIIDIVLKTDWSYWYNITRYDPDHQNKNECCGTIVRLSKPCGDIKYAAPVLYQGKSHSVSSFIPSIGYINIHNHPYQDTDNIHLMFNQFTPSIADYNASVDKYSLVVTINGVVIYGLFNQCTAEFIAINSSEHKPGMYMRIVPWKYLHTPLYTQLTNIEFDSIFNLSVDCDQDPIFDSSDLFDR